jgi:hypothetical protein
MTVYAPYAWVAHDWHITDHTDQLSGQRIAALPVLFDQPHVWCYDANLAQLDLTQFDLVILSDIEFEQVTTVQQWCRDKGIKNYLLATGGQIQSDTFDSACMVYRPWWCYNLLKMNQFVDTDTTSRLFLFDALLGARRPHRDYAMLSLQQTGLLDRSIVTYRDIFTTGGVVNQQTEQFARIFKDQTLLYPYVSPNLPADWEVRPALDKSISPFIPWNIYRNTWYSIITETLGTGNCFFFSEKTTKALYAERLFVVFSSAGYLKGLHQLGFETFGDIIDESYDSDPLDFSRFDKISKQLIRLSQLDPVLVYKQIKPRLQRNRQRLLDLPEHTRKSMQELKAQFDVLE